jgi:hypothetical protein
MNGLLRLTLMAFTLTTLTAGCVAPSPDQSGIGQSGEARVRIVEPLDGAEVSGPVLVKFGAENFVVEATGPEVKAGHGHLHVMVNTDCIAANQVIPKDETHLHFGKGQMEAKMNLTPGEHTLCLQAADNNHVALEGAGMTHTIKVVVK